jgi:hypothetical protein
MNSTFIVDEIDIDTKRPHIDTISSNNVEILVKQIKVRETRFHQGLDSTKWHTPRVQAALKIKQRVLTPFHHDWSKLDTTRVSSSTMVSSGTKIIPDIVVTEFLDLNNNELSFTNKENLNNSNDCPIRKTKT